MNKHNPTITVECYAGHRGEEYPRRFSIGKKSVEVSKILDRWIAPDHPYFKLQGEDKSVYIIRYDVKTGQWEVTMFDSGKLDQTQLSSA